MGHLDDIQTALKPLKQIEKKCIYIFITILGLTESFKTMNRPNPARHDHNEVCIITKQTRFKVAL